MEYRRVDTAVFTEDNLTDLIEFKSGYVFDILDNPNANNDAIKWVEKDFKKLKNIEILNQNAQCRQCSILIAVDVKPGDKILTSGHGRFIKYKDKINRFMKSRSKYNIFEDATNVIEKAFAQPNYQVAGGAFKTGKAFACDVDIYYWIITDCLKAV